jgi:predicted  nucleic acid-binding Zn ribbon protein
MDNDDLKKYAMKAESDCPDCGKKWTLYQDLHEADVKIDGTVNLIATCDCGAKWPIPIIGVKIPL